jgi:hypothetical protein
VWGTPVMSRVFLAYKTVDRDRANVVRAKLEALGVPLFIDQKLLSGDNYLVAINEELKTAIAVLVLWTEAAVSTSDTGEPNFVLSEAQRGYARNILVAATLEKIALDHLPVPFNLFQAPDISDWIPTGASARHSEWQKILQALGRKLGRPGLGSLAIALESEGDELKKEFLKNYPSDPFAEQIAAALEAFERKQFEQRIATARKRALQRSKEAEKRLKSCREEFEKQIVELRAGRDFMPPDPVTALDDNIAKLSDQIEVYENALRDQRARADEAESSAGKSTAELAALKEEHARASDKNEELLEQQIAQLHATSISSRQRSQQDGRRLIQYSGLAALVAACLGAFIGWWLSPTNAVQPGTAVQELKSQITDLQGQIKTWQTRQGDLERQQNDIAAQKQQLAGQQADLNKQKADLTQQQNALAADKTKFTQQQDFNKAKSALDQQQQDFNKAKLAFEQQQRDFDAKQKELVLQQQKLEEVRQKLADYYDQQKAILAQQQQDLAKAKLDFEKQRATLVSAGGALSSAAQCDALAGYQYDPDRPANSGWIEKTENIPAAAQTICNSALQTSGSDRITQRRLKLQLGRTYQATQPETALDYWKQAARLDSSQADFILGRYYYGDHKSKNFDPDTAWTYITKAADLNDSAPNPAALYAVAYNHLIHDTDNNVLRWERHNTATGEIYLQKALNADFPAAYWIAGIHYWDTNEKLARSYLITSFCVKHYKDPTDKAYDARGTFERKTGSPLTCQ